MIARTALAVDEPGAEFVALLLDLADRFVPRRAVAILNGLVLVESGRECGQMIGTECRRALNEAGLRLLQGQQLAAKVANTIAENYLAFQQNARQEQTRAAGRWLGGEIENMRKRVAEAGSEVEKSWPLGLSYPRGFYSLSHVALPFPISDSLYGVEPDPSENFGENLGTLAPRGERNVLIASLDSLMRASSNPFFPYMTEQIGKGIPAEARATQHVQ